MKNEDKIFQKSLSKVWHSVEEEPQDQDAMILLVNDFFENPTVCDLGIFSCFCDEEEYMWEEAIACFQNGYWAYFKDLIPTNKKGGTK